ncbi:MAG: protein-L-isoaspartate O-methyltransferase [Alphaproteobacteria bacterium]|nr:protein-L-isoaspartate O-methyltransferase [Alphaproteobacteria bacterium]
MQADLLTQARRNMVDCQLRPNRVTDERIIAAMAEVRRELFVPGPLRGVAYLDEDIALAPGRVMIEPVVFARMAQAAEIRPGDVVLALGDASGYVAAVLGRLAQTVVAVESDGDLAARAQRALSQCGCEVAAVVTGPLEAGYARQAPYDVIFVAGAVERVPPALLAQLAEGGRLVAVVNDREGGRQATLFTRQGGAIGKRPLFDAATPVLPGFARAPGFVF